MTFKLCYRFVNSKRGAPFEMFPLITATTVAFDTVDASGTAPGCVSTVNISVINAGRHLFEGHGGLEPLPTCLFEGFGTSDATFVGESVLSCRTPLLANGSVPSPGRYPLKLDYGPRLFPLPVLDTFAVWDWNETAHVASLYPEGGPYNEDQDVLLTGTFTLYGSQPYCRVGGAALGGKLLWTNATHAACSRPRLPDSARSMVGAIDVVYSPSGQCERSISSYALFNSGIEMLAGATGAPSSVPLDIQIAGVGLKYPQLLTAACRYTPLGHTAPTVIRPVVVDSTTLARCLGTPSGAAGSYAVDLLQVRILEQRQQILLVSPLHIATMISFIRPFAFLHIYLHLPSRVTSGRRDGGAPTLRPPPLSHVRPRRRPPQCVATTRRTRRRGERRHRLRDWLRHLRPGPGRVPRRWRAPARRLHQRAGDPLPSATIALREGERDRRLA